MTRRERNLLVALAVIGGVALCALSLFWVNSRNAANSQIVKNNEKLITQLLSQINQQLIGGSPQDNDSNRLASLRRQKEALRNRNTSVATINVFNFSQMLRNELQSHNIQLKQMQIVAKSQTVNIQGSGRAADILSLLQSIDTHEYPIHTWSFGFDLGDKSGEIGGFTWEVGYGKQL